MSSRVPRFWVFVSLFKDYFVFFSISYMQCSKTQESVPKTSSYSWCLPTKSAAVFSVITSRWSGQAFLNLLHGFLWPPWTARDDPAGHARSHHSVPSLHRTWRWENPFSALSCHTNSSGSCTFHFYILFCLLSRTGV